MKLQFHKNPTKILDKAICYITDGPYYHVELNFESIKLPSDNNCFSSDWKDKGTRFKRIDFAAEACQWDSLAISLSTEAEQKIYNWCLTELGSGYDYMGALRFAFPVLKPSTDRWFCSEVCLAALQQVGLFGDLVDFQFSPVLMYQAINQAINQALSK